MIQAKFSDQFVLKLKKLKIKVKNLFADENKDRNLGNPDMAEAYG